MLSAAYFTFTYLPIPPPGPMGHYYLCSENVNSCLAAKKEMPFRRNVCLVGQGEHKIVS
jgi:hypothetical protein